MPKSKKRKRAGRGQESSTTGKISWGGKSGAGARRNNIVIAAILVVGLAAGGIYWARTAKDESRFLALAAEGQGSLTRIEAQVDHGGGHLNPGEAQSYAEGIPTSGRHNPSPIMPGFYDKQQRPTRLVHSLEHGHVVIYFEKLDPEATRLVRAWTDLYDGKWDGVVAAPLSGLGERVVLAAWTKLLRLDRFDAPATAAFIDRFRGRGPENPVR